MAMAVSQCASILPIQVNHHPCNLLTISFCTRVCRWCVKRHRRIHTGEKPFACPECKRGFTQQGSLRNHMRIHTDERPFECKCCGQRFRDPSVLARHRRLHTEYAKVYSCPECGKRFALKADAKRHLRIHTGERPYPCKECGQRFRDLGHWRRHERLVHAKKYTLTCPYCGKGSAAMWNLRMHLRARHNVTMAQPADPVIKEEDV